MARTFLIGIIREYFTNYQILSSFVRDLKGITFYLKTILRVKSGSKVRLLMENDQFLSLNFKASVHRYNIQELFLFDFMPRTYLYMTLNLSSLYSKTLIISLNFDSTSCFEEQCHVHLFSSISYDSHRSEYFFYSLFKSNMQ